MLWVIPTNQTFVLYWGNPMAWTVAALVRELVMDVGMGGIGEVQQARQLEELVAVTLHELAQGPQAACLGLPGHERARGGGEPGSTNAPAPEPDDYAAALRAMDASAGLMTLREA